MVTYRTVQISWLPHTPSQWKTFDSSRQEAARLWADLVERHFRIRRRRLKWPSLPRWMQWAKRRYPSLNSQSVQQIIFEFREALESSLQLRKKDQRFHFPWKKPKFRDVIYTNQAIRMKDGFLVLPNGKAGKLKVKLPKTIKFPGRLIEVRLSFGKLLFICQIEETPLVERQIIGIDLGVNSLIAATNGEKALVVSGREIKASIQWRNKNLASIASKQTRKKAGSSRWKRLQKRKLGMLAKAKNRITDLVHKTTNLVVKEFPGTRVYVGKSFNDAAQFLGRVQAQQVSQAVNAKITGQLDYKTCGAIQVEEYYTSQTCPVCEERNKCGRVYSCNKCGLKAPRDVIGAVNIRSIGMLGKMVLGRPLPSRIIFKYPAKFPSKGFAGSSCGHQAGSSVVLHLPRSG